MILSATAVLFDCDGVLVDSEPITNRVLSEMLGELGWQLSVEETMRIFVGKTVKDEAALIEARTGYAITTEWLMQFRARRNTALDRELQAIAGAASAVRALHTALTGRIAVASGAPCLPVMLFPRFRQRQINYRAHARIVNSQNRPYIFLPRSCPFPLVRRKT